MNRRLQRGHVFSVCVREVYFSPLGNAIEAEDMIAVVDFASVGDRLETDAALELVSLLSSLHLNFIIFDKIKFYLSPTGQPLHQSPITIISRFQSLQ